MVQVFGAGQTLIRLALLGTFPQGKAYKQSFTCSHFGVELFTNCSPSLDKIGYNIGKDKL
jgi:hypothetical protein